VLIFNELNINSVKLKDNFLAGNEYTW